jgi:hypothetical protein
MLTNGAIIRTLGTFTVLTLISGCGSPTGDTLEDLLRKQGNTPPIADGGPPTPLPVPPAPPTGDARPPMPPPIPPPVPPPAQKCVKELPPPPSDEQCPAAGTPCPNGLPPLLPCKQGNLNAFMACDGPPAVRTWRLDLIECPPPAPPECVNDLPPPPSDAQCPAAGTSCPNGLPPLLPCKLGDRDAFMSCDGPSVWRLAYLACR